MSQQLAEILGTEAFDRRAYVSSAIARSVAAQQALLSLDDTLFEIADVMVRALRAGRTVFAFGNGGSAAQAQHLVGELVGRFARERPALSAFALGTDPSVITALANDYGCRSIFSRQLEALGRPGDVAVGLSTSGRSPNVLEALDVAQARGLVTVGLTGIAGSKLASMTDVCLRIPADDTARVQESHLVAIHVICGLVERELFD